MAFPLFALQLQYCDRPGRRMTLRQSNYHSVLKAQHRHIRGAAGIISWFENQMDCTALPHGEQTDGLYGITTWRTNRWIVRHYHMENKQMDCTALPHGEQTDGLYGITTWRTNRWIVRHYHMENKQMDCTALPHGEQTDGLYGITTWRTNRWIVRHYHMENKQMDCTALPHGEQTSSIIMKTTRLSNKGKSQKKVFFCSKIMTIAFAQPAGMT